MLRVLHTSDWHLGHSLHGHDRREEHGAFLAWLLEVVGRQRIDALIVAGDVFETANPPTSAVRQLYEFLGEARRRYPKLDVLIIGGNHDSALRLDAHAPLFGPLGIRVVGSLPRGDDGQIDGERLCVPLHDAGGSVAAWVAAVPYLRIPDLPAVAAEEVGPTGEGDKSSLVGFDPLIAGVREVYGRALQLAASRCAPNQALLATGHCFMTGTRLSELSERKVLGGNLHALPTDVFDGAAREVAYVALGHLHLAQEVGGRAFVRYSGSPLPLSATESDYDHQVVLVELDGPDLVAAHPILVPRTVAMLRVPADGPGPLERVADELRDLGPRLESLETAPDPARPSTWPFLTVEVSLDGPTPRLREAIDEALGLQPVRLLRIEPHYVGTGGSFADTPVRRELAEVRPEEVFEDCYARQYGDAPPSDLREAFAELLESTLAGGGDGGPG